MIIPTANAVAPASTATPARLAALLAFSPVCGKRALELFTLVTELLLFTVS